MKSILLGVLFVGSLALSAQDSNPERKLSNYEFGVSFDTYNGTNFTPKLNYKYYRTEENVLNFGASLTYGGFYQAYQFEFWNEYRNYLCKNKKWFLSHGLSASVGYSSLDYGNLNQGESFSGFGFGLGYNLGVGYKINDRFSIQAIIKPKINLMHRSMDGTSNAIYIRSPFSLGVNYRF